MTFRLLPCGEAALLVEVGSLPEVLQLADALRAAVLPGVVDLVPAARTVLLTAADPTALAALRPLVTDLANHLDDRPAATQGSTLAPLVIEVIYDGEDLAEVGWLTGLTEDEVVAAHTGTPWRAAFGGFAPGFAYLTGGDARLRVPRRATPRPRVPAGSVGLADEFSGVYPTASPGGWQLIGRTTATLWDVDRDPPALIVPGREVRFEAVR